MSEERFDRVTRLAQRTFGVPVVLIALADGSRWRLLSRAGIDRDELPRVDGEENPLRGEMSLPFYAGQALFGPGGDIVGVLSLHDRVARELDLEQKRALRDLAGMVQEQFAADAAKSGEEKRRVVERLRSAPEIQASHRRAWLVLFGAAVVVVGVSLFAYRLTGRFTSAADGIEAALAAGDAASAGAALRDLRSAVALFRLALGFRGAMALLVLGAALAVFTRHSEAGLSERAEVALERDRLRAELERARSSDSPLSKRPENS